MHSPDSQINESNYISVSPNGAKGLLEAYSKSHPTGNFAFFHDSDPKENDKYVLSFITEKSKKVYAVGYSICLQNIWQFSIYPPSYVVSEGTPHVHFSSDNLRSPMSSVNVGKCNLTELWFTVKANWAKANEPFIDSGKITLLSVEDLTKDLNKSSTSKTLEKASVPPLPQEIKNSPYFWETTTHEGAISYLNMYHPNDEDVMILRESSQPGHIAFTKKNKDKPGTFTRALIPYRVDSMGRCLFSPAIFSPEKREDIVFNDLTFEQLLSLYKEKHRKPLPKLDGGMTQSFVQPITPIQSSPQRQQIKNQPVNVTSHNPNNFPSNFFSSQVNNPYPRTASYHQQNNIQPNPAPVAMLPNNAVPFTQSQIPAQPYQQVPLNQGLYPLTQPITQAQVQQQYTQGQSPNPFPTFFPPIPQQRNIPPMVIIIPATSSAPTPTQAFFGQPQNALLQQYTFPQNNSQHQNNSYNGAPGYNNSGWKG